MQIAKRTDPSYKECHYTINPSKSITFYPLFRNSFMEKYQLVNLTTVQPLSAYLRLWAYIFKHPFKPLAEPHERVSQKYFTYLPPLSTFDSLWNVQPLHLDREHHTYNKKLLWGKWAGFFRPFPPTYPPAQFIIICFGIVFKNFISIYSGFWVIFVSLSRFSSDRDGELQAEGYIPLLKTKPTKGVREREGGRGIKTKGCETVIF